MTHLSTSAGTCFHLPQPGLMQVSDIRDAEKGPRPGGVVIVPAHTQAICAYLPLLLRLERSMRLTEMYEHNVRRNEQPHRTFFIITHNDYELNFGGEKKPV